MKKIHYSRKLKQFKILSGRVQYLLRHPGEGSILLIQKIKEKLKALIHDLRFAYSYKELKKIMGAAILVFGLSFSNQISAQWFDAPVLNPFGLSSMPYTAQPAFADLDNDGDLDLLVGKYVFEYSAPYETGRLEYFENTGSASDPSFASPVENPFGLSSTYYYAMPAFADLDNDGDMDLMVSDYYNGLHYFENTGTVSEPAFADPILNPFNIEFNFSFFLFPITFADIDNDGDMDLFAGESYLGYASFNGNIQYFENTGTAADPTFTSPVENPFGLTNTFFLACPTLADLDGDGDLDLIVGEGLISGTSNPYDGNFQYFENTGTANDPAFADPVLNPFGLVSTNYLALATFVDLDNDGDFDLLVGEYYGALEYYENVNSSDIDELINTNSISIYPNPVKDILRIDTEKSIDRVEIIDILGKTSMLQLEGSNQLSIGDLSLGIYTLKITFKDGNQAAKKILKE